MDSNGRLSSVFSALRDTEGIATFQKRILVGWGSWASGVSVRHRHVMPGLIHILVDVHRSIAHFGVALDVLECLAYLCTTLTRLFSPCADRPCVVNPELVAEGYLWEVLANLF